IPVRTLQNEQARVHVSPMIISVACFLVQHSPMFGHPASSHTVTSFASRTIFLVSRYPSLVGAFTRIHDGLRCTGVSSRPCFSGCRGRESGPPFVSSSVAMWPVTSDRPRMKTRRYVKLVWAFVLYAPQVILIPIHKRARWAP